MHTRAARLGRGWLAASLATFVAAFSHVAGGGAAPTWLAIVASLVLSGTLCTLLAGRNLSLIRLSFSVFASQAMFHGLFSSLGTPTVASHSHELALVTATVHDHTTMWAAHAVAAVITIIALRFGEAAFWGMAGIARMFLLRLLSWPAPTTVLRPRAVDVTEQVIQFSTRFLSIMRRRGPPRYLAA